MTAPVLVTAAATAALVIATASAAPAADKPPQDPVDSRLLTGVFPPDPEGVWRRIGQTDSTSTCIGDPVTPLCAIETLVACMARRNSEFCQIAAAHFLGPPPRFRGTGWTKQYDRYRIYRVVSVRRATAEDVRAGRTGINQRHIGDLLVDIEWQACFKFPWEHRCDTFSRPTTHTVRRFKGRWIVVDIVAPRY